MDLTRIDIGYDAKQAGSAETGDPRHAPSSSVTELASSGDLGRKTGRGWNTYDTDGNQVGGALWTWR
jgi:3-hydroxybutyryl-CoA dehydrogenase